MKRAAILGAMLCALAAPLGAQAADSAEVGVRAALQHYLDGHATGQGEHFALGMHPVLQMLWVREGQLQRRTRDEYVAGASGSPAADEAQRRRRIEHIDITGSAAVAKVVLDYPSVRFTDYMSLLRVDGEWRIVGKIFHAEPRTPR